MELSHFIFKSDLSCYYILKNVLCFWIIPWYETFVWFLHPNSDHWKFVCLICPLHYQKYSVAWFLNININNIFKIIVNFFNSNVFTIAILIGSRNVKALNSTDWTKHVLCFMRIECISLYEIFSFHHSKISFGYYKVMILFHFTNWTARKNLSIIVKNTSLF